MARRTKEALLKEILDQLRQKDLSINELAQESNWSTIRDAVSLLKDLGLVETREDKNAVICSIKKGVDTSLIDGMSKDTLFKIPITKEQDNLFSFIFSKIQQDFAVRWKREPKTTEVEKIAAEVIFDMKLNAPIGWYLHGMISVKLYNASSEYVFEEPDDHEAIEEEIVNKVEIYGKYAYISDLIREQYKVHHNKLYQIKEELQKITLPAIDLNNKETKSTIMLLLRHLMFELPRKEDAQEVNNLTEGYVRLMDRLFLAHSDINQYKVDLYNIFDSVWKFIATYNLLDSLVTIGGYDRKSLLRYLDTPLVSAKMVAQENLRILTDICPDIKQMPELIIEDSVQELIRKSFIDMALQRDDGDSEPTK